jgi:stage IV sporulation protein FB
MEEQFSSTNSETAPVAEPKPEVAAPQTSVPRTIISLLLYLAVDYLIFESWYAVGVLVGVVFLHELGHLLAMKLYGYRGVNMTFVPFVGAYVSGITDNPSRLRRCVVLLAGPLPGIIIGCAAFITYVNTMDERLLYPSILFLLLNGFNLLPVAPLDGGQLMEALYLGRSRYPQLIFLGLCVLLVGVGVMQTRQYTLLILLLPLLARISHINLKFKVRRQWRLQQLDFNKGWDELSDAEYWQMRDVLVRNSSVFSKYADQRDSPAEHTFANMIKNFLNPLSEDDLGGFQKIVFTLIWLLFLVTPILLVLWHKGYL